MKNIFTLFVLIAALITTGASAQQAGLLDSSYGYYGKGYIFGVSNIGNAALQPDNKVVMVGTNYIGASSTIAVGRLTTAGFADSTFSGDGKLSINISTSSTNNYSFAGDVVVQPDGKIVVAGYNYYQFGLLRLKPNGDRDSTFGTNGLTLTPAAEQFHHANKVLLQPDGKIVVVGTTTAPDCASWCSGT